MKFKLAHLILFIFSCFIINLCQSIPLNSSQASIAISDVVRELFIKDGIKFDTIIYGNFTSHLRDIVDGVQKKLQYQTQIIHAKEVLQNFFYLYLPAFILVENVKSWSVCVRKIYVLNKFPMPLKFLVYISDEYESPKYATHHFMFSAHITQIAYYLTHTENKIELWSSEEFNEDSCNKLSHIVYNNFNGTWEKALKIEERFRNFYGCEITIAAKNSSVRRMNYYREGERDFGIVHDIIELIALKGNFTQKIFYYTNLEDPQLEEEGPQVECDLWGVLQYEFGPVHISSSFDSIEMVFDMTPPEKFTNWEKVLLPFDEETWKFLLITFGVAFALIFIINRLPISVRNLFYGEGVRVPAFNIAGTFFGIGQLRLPDGNFARILLMIFILFCLIIRTAYQGVLFEMMTTEMRKKPPETIEDLYKQNYSIVRESSNWSISMLHDMIPKNIRPKIITEVDLNFSSYEEAYELNIRNESAKLAFLLINRPAKRGVQLKEILFTTSAGIGTRRNNFLFDLIEETMKPLIAGGIPQHIDESYMEKFYPNIPEDPSEPQVLSLDDLSYGFIIWLVACSTNFIAFVAELLMKKYGEEIIRKVKHNLSEIIGLIFVLNWLRKYLKNYKV